MEPQCSIGDYVVCEYHRHAQPDNSVVIMANFADLPDVGECAIKRIKEDESAWIFSSDNPKYNDIKVTKEDMDEYPIYGTVIYNLTKRKAVGGVEKERFQVSEEDRRRWSPEATKNRWGGYCSPVGKMIILLSCADLSAVLSAVSLLKEEA